MVEIRFMNPKLVKSTHQSKNSRIFRVHENIKGRGGIEQRENWINRTRQK